MSAYEIPALARANSILLALASSRHPLGIPQLLERIDIPRSTVYLMLETLENLRWIDKVDGGYCIGIKLLEIGNAYARNDGLIARFHEVAKTFVMECNEVAQMAVLDGLEIVYIAREDAPQPIRLVSDLGSRLPATCSALGKALLSSLPDHVLNILVPDTFPGPTRASVKTRGALMAQITEIRENGIAIERQEVSDGLVCLAAFVGVTAEGRRMAVSTSIPIFRISAAVEAKLTKRIAMIARTIGQGLPERSY